MDPKKIKKVAVIAAHPDDETLWAGGTMLNEPSWKCFVVCLCRKSDPDRAPKFFKALAILGADGIMGDLDDGPEQTSLSVNEVKQAILRLIPDVHFDLIITHNPNGEYTRHLRHEEISRAVINLWAEGTLVTKELWTFAYEDGHKAYYPKAELTATSYWPLPPKLRELKYSIITQTYGFDKSSWEAQTSPGEEAFWHFSNAQQAKNWLAKGGTAS